MTGAPAGPDAPVASPCIGLCRLDPATGWCLGCRRSIEEIAAWRDLSDPARRRVLAALAARRAADPSPEPPAGEGSA